MSFYNATSKKTDKAGHLYRVFGKEQQPVSKAIPGDIIAVSKLEDMHISDTICDPKHQVKFPEIAFPPPMCSLAVIPLSKGAEKKISECLHKLTEEDKTFRISHDALTNELVITGMSTLHLQVMISRLKRRFGIDVEAHTPKIPYKETITARAQAQYNTKSKRVATDNMGKFISGSNRYRGALGLSLWTRLSVAPSPGNTSQPLNKGFVRFLTGVF